MKMKYLTRHRPGDGDIGRVVKLMSYSRRRRSRRSSLFVKILWTLVILECTVFLGWMLYQCSLTQRVLDSIKHF